MKLTTQKKMLAICSQAELGRRLNRRAQTVNGWFKKKVPGELVVRAEEHGAYLLLMFNYWQTGRPIPKNRLSKIARLSNDRWDAVEPSLKEFFNDNGTEWVQERIERDLEAVKNSISQKSAAGKASAQARKAKKGANNQQNNNGCSTGVEPSLKQNANGNPTNKDPDTDLKENQERELYAPGGFLPPIGKFPITDDWTPSDDFVRQAAQWGINLGDLPGYTAVELQQFRDYWKCEGKVKHHIQWEQTFASSLKTSRANSSTPSAGTRRQAGFGVSQPDTQIPPGFRG